MVTKSRESCAQLTELLFRHHLRVASHLILMPLLPQLLFRRCFFFASDRRIDSRTGPHTTHASPLWHRRQCVMAYRVERQLGCRHSSSRQVRTCSSRLFIRAHCWATLHRLRRVVVVVIPLVVVVSPHSVACRTNRMRFCVARILR